MVKSGDERWIVDPIDGTVDSHGYGIPILSIGVERDGNLIAGVVYEPIHDELFWAESGAGSYLNRKRLRVSERSTLADCIATWNSV